jgi:hypothetical protein
MCRAKKNSARHPTTYFRSGRRLNEHQGRADEFGLMREASGRERGGLCGRRRA